MELCESQTALNLSFIGGRGGARQFEKLPLPLTFLTRLKLLA